VVWGHTMKIQRRRLLQLCAGAIALLAVSRVATAQTYPMRPITMVVAFAAGGTTDVIGRVIAARMRDSLKQSVIVENVSGADGSIGTGRTARARPDGYTIDLGGTTTHVMIGAVYSLPYDVLNDFEPVSPVVMAPFILFARKTMPANDLNGLIAWLKANPKASAAYTAVVTHLLTEALKRETGTQITLVPYRGASPAMQDLVAGQIDLFLDPPPSMELMRAGSIKAYAVTSDRRIAAAPDLPTFREMGLPTVSHSEWWGLFAPKGTPKDVIGKLNAALVEALTDAAVQSRLAEIGAEIFPRERQTPEALRALVKSDAEKWWPIIKEFGIKVE
jgi:tripartite-type tricarboxylate transporter receptor subunit TctC